MELLKFWSPELYFWHVKPRQGSKIIFRNAAVAGEK